MAGREAAILTLRRWRHGILAFVRECCGAEPDSWQVDALLGVQNGNRQATVGSKGCGKTTVEAWAIWWFLLTRPHANIAVTSVSGDNLRDGLWKELAVWRRRSPILAAAFDWQSTRIVSREHPSTWWASARTWSKSADTQQQADTLAGLHADHVMFVLDEAGSIPLAVSVTAEAALSSGIECKLVLAGNPTSLDGPLYQAAVTQRQLWSVVAVTGDPDDPKRSPRVDLQWANDQISTYGRENPWVKVNVLGQFPAASLNALLGIDDVLSAMERKLPADSYSFAQKRLGIDVARYGDDRTVIFPRQGLQAFQPTTLRHDRGSAVSVEIADCVLAKKRTWSSDLEFFDATGGWAAGAVDVLRAHGYRPLNCQFAGPAADARFRNRRAEMWWNMAEWVKSGAGLPNIPELVAELTTPTYTFNSGRLQIEEKDQVKRRLGRSPDLADALALTFGMTELPRHLRAEGNIGKAITLDSIDQARLRGDFGDLYGR